MILSIITLYHFSVKKLNAFEAVMLEKRVSDSFKIMLQRGTDLMKCYVGLIGLIL